MGLDRLAGRHKTGHSVSRCSPAQQLFDNDHPPDTLLMVLRVVPRTVLNSQM